MGIVYSGLVAAAPNNKTVATTLKPINSIISGYHWCMSPIYKVWFSDAVQGGLQDALMANDLYLKYLFPYIMYGAFFLAAWGPDTNQFGKEFMKMQYRYQIDSEIEKNPKFEQRYAELQALC